MNSFKVFFALLGLLSSLPALAQANPEFTDNVRAPLALELPGELPLRDAVDELCARSLRISGMDYKNFQDWRAEALTAFGTTALELRTLGDPTLTAGFMQNIDIDEATAFYAYSSACFRSINPLLYAGSFYERTRFNAIMRAINHVLEQLPEFHGVVHRGVAPLPEGFLRRHRVGGPAVIYPAYTSTSRLQHSGFGGCVVYRIHSHHGRMVHALSAHYTEQEVLFPPGTAFRVLSRVDLPPVGNCTQRVEFEMEDVGPQEAASSLIRRPLLNLPQRQQWFNPHVL